ncbi:MAG: TatD family hydrolase [Zymomonas mobilis subsp. pomaceae]|uniref:Hydrolase, TatD family n=1 Tax=Zymomonas mobilis subsp. pomaceae (strain ATCC 29192 / DSM 22645 / JCM 10191 / CCUG 17912 / NBRC 13757 / NCIMB 11200 / NRRL B-4491 / Barker I) TaxID=579138 RepID=F8EU19_ZYMMT|nr:TatD family hydrolase [Zymomonas mobilis]AEI37099.1 hydrolase, TatD family [Zymomonas mobilis subsp. pomaceae ATCC 29192]MDX5948470.1 TatD family hydrolase [Zymomonas mobilis subsp. pomaceae]GEB89465.1 TatD-related deoxyribonuclease [Zymomonas mobilis subsp. pomaceae]
MLIDSHCHLNYPGLFERQAEILEHARQAGVTGMVNVATKESEWNAIIATAEREKDVWASVGIHPNEAAAHPAIDSSTLIKAANHPRVVAIGESGLDYFYGENDFDQQKAGFREHIIAARETGLPLIVHMRNAEDDTANILEEEMKKAPFKGLIHCFTASADFAERMLKIGFYISISGIVTFKNAEDLRDTIQNLPLDRLMVETDSPFLAPVPYRGKKGEPAFVADTAHFLSQLFGMRYEAFTEITSHNFLKLFDKVKL